MKKKISSVILAAFLSLTMLTGCAGSSGGTKETSETVNGSVIGTVSSPSGTLEWVKYEDPNHYLTLNAPKGWSVSTYDFGYDGNTFCGTKVIVFNEELGVGVSMLDGFTIKKSVMSAPTTEAYFEQLFSPEQGVTEWNVKSSSRSDWLQSKVNEINSTLTILIYDAKTLRVEWTQKGVMGEGVYECIVESSNTSSNAYFISNMSAAYAPRGAYDQWAGILDQIKASLSFNESYTSYRKAQLENMMGTNNQQAANNGGTAVLPGSTGYYDMSDSYAARDKANDINHQKFDDYILGRDRMQDNSTGDIYYTDPSFYEDYQNAGGQRYSPIEDSQYLDDPTGTIGW